MSNQEKNLDSNFKDAMKKILDKAYACSKGTCLSFMICTDTHYGFTGDNGALLFCHCPIRKNLNWNHENIHNDERLQKTLREFHSNSGHKILAYIHGHVHVDSWNFDPALGFPMLGIGCSKFENIIPTDINTGFPPNSVKPLREAGKPSEELWDVLIYNATERKLNFIRFGAGEDRTIDLTNLGSVSTLSDTDALVSSKRL